MRRREVEQDAVRAQVVRSHLSVRRKVTDRANYVALPSVAARGAAERREIRRDERRLKRLSDPAPGRAVPSPKIPQLERRKAMRFLSLAAAGETQEARQDNLRLSALHAPHRGRNQKLNLRFGRGNMIAWLFGN